MYNSTENRQLNLDGTISDPISISRDTKFVHINKLSTKKGTDYFVVTFDVIEEDHGLYLLARKLQQVLNQFHTKGYTVKQLYNAD